MFFVYEYFFLLRVFLIYDILNIYKSVKFLIWIYISLKDIKKIVENNPIVIATVINSNKPNTVTVMFVKVVSENEVLVTDNFMNQTLKDIKQNNNVAISVWNKEFKGYKLIGKAKYYNKGQWLDSVKAMKENKGLPAKGAILIKVSKIIPAC